MVNIIIYLANGKTVKAYLKRRQYDYLTDHMTEKRPIKRRIRSWLKSFWLNR